MGRLKELWATYGEEVQFFVVYIKEAHPLDGSSPLGGGDHPIVEDPQSLEERRSVAKDCMDALDMAPIPMLVDDLDDGVRKAYASWPDRLYLVGTDGRIAYRGGPGPGGFKPDELEKAIRSELGLVEPPEDSE